MLRLILLATLGAWLGYANPIFQLPIAVLAFPLSLAWIGLRADHPKKAFKIGWIAGVLASVGCFYWIVIPVQFYGGLPWYIALPCPILLAAFMGIWYGLFAMVLHYSGKYFDYGELCLFAGLLWASMEMLIGTAFSGLPWMTLSSAFAPWPVFIQLASIIGAYGLSGILASLAVAILLYLTHQKALKIGLVILIAILGFGAFQLKRAHPEPTYPISIAQGNFDQGLKWSPNVQRETVQRYAELSLQAIEQHKPHVVIWPETAMPFYLQDRSALRKAVTVLAHDTQTPIITGSPAYRVTDMKTGKYVLFNRAWLVDDTGRTTQWYDKEHLVPFGEYMPFAEWMPFEQLVQAAGNFIPGKNNNPLQVDGIALGVLICYEAIFPELAQQQVDRGATILVNISNDAWFGETSAPQQHLNLTIMRAVEQGRWLVRSTNTGISAFIDPIGQVRAISSQFVAEQLTSNVEPIVDTTVFHEIYHWVQRGIYFLTILGFIWLLFAAKENKRTT